MTALDALGLTASFLTTASFVPQVWRMWRTRDVSGISLLMYGVFTVGIALWLAYGWLRQDLALIVANSVTLVLAVAITVMKIRFGTPVDAKSNQTSASSK